MLQLLTIEVRIAADDACRVNKRHATLQRLTGRIGEGVGIDTSRPGEFNQPRLTSQLGGGFLDEARLQASPRQRDDRRHEEKDENQRAEHELLRECHGYTSTPLITMTGLLRP